MLQCYLPWSIISYMFTAKLKSMMLELMCKYIRTEYFSPRTTLFSAKRSEMSDKKSLIRT